MAYKEKDIRPYVKLIVEEEGKMYKGLQDAHDSEVVLSALLLRDYLYSL